MVNLSSEINRSQLSYNQHLKRKTLDIKPITEKIQNYIFQNDVLQYLYTSYLHQRSSHATEVSHHKECPDCHSSTGPTNSLQLSRATDPSILDLKQGKSLEIGEIQCPEKVEVEAQGPKSPPDPWVKMQNLVSAVEETDIRGKAWDKATSESTNSRNH